MKTDLLQNETTLSPSQQEVGLRRYLWFTRINAISFSCLAESTLILYAIKNGADDFLVGLLTSFFYLTMPLMFLGKRMVGKRGAASTYAISWALRNTSAAIMIAVPIVIQTVSLKAGLGLLAISVFGFFAFRSMGLTANTPIIGEITNKNNRGHNISKIWLHFNIFYLINLSILIYILGQHDHILTFQGIIAFGSVTGIISSALIYRVPESSSTMLSGKQSVGRSILYIWKNQRPRKLLFAWTATTVIIMLVIPFAMVALKNGYQVSDHNALFFALIQILGAVVAASVNSIVLDRVGPRPMLILYSFGLLAVSFLWIIAPGSLIVYYPATMFLLLGICRAGAMTTLNHYFLTIVPDKERVGANMFIYMISGAVAGLTGTFLGGGLLKFLYTFEFNGLNIYRIYFTIILFVLIPVFFVIRRIEPVTDWRIKDVLGIFVSFRDIRALFTLQRLEQESNLAQEYLGVKKLREVPSELSEKKLLAYLDSPRFNIRGKALGALGQINFSAKTAKALIREVERGEYTTSYIAAEILGDYGIKDAVPVLRRSLDSEDVYLQGKSMVALAQLGDELSYKQIEQIFINSLNPRIIIHGARAIVQMADLNRLILLLEKAVIKGIPKQVREELLYGICEMCDCGDEFYRFLKAYKINQNNGFLAFQEIVFSFVKNSEKDLGVIEKQICCLKSQVDYNCDAIAKFIQKSVFNRKTPISKTIKKFLHQLDSQCLYVDLIYCLSLILAKDVSNIIG